MTRTLLAVFLCGAGLQAQSAPPPTVRVAAVVAVGRLVTIVNAVDAPTLTFDRQTRACDLSVFTIDKQSHFATMDPAVCERLIRHIRQGGVPLAVSPPRPTQEPQ